MSIAVTPVTNEKPPRRRRLWVVALACLIGFAAIPVLGYFYLSWATAREIEAAIAEVERVDPRWRFDDLLADRKPIADAENPAVVVGKVDALLSPGSYDIGEKNWRLFENPSSVNQLNGPQIAALRESLTKHAEAVKVARTLKDFSGEGRFAIKISPDFFSTNLDSLQRCRNVMSMLEHDAMLQAEDGDATGALESCQALLVTARAAGEEPYLIAALIRCAGEGIFVNALERTLAQGEPPAAQLKSLQDLIAKENDATFFIQAMRGERGGSEAMIETLQNKKVKMSDFMAGGGAGGGSWENWLVDMFPTIMLRGRPEHIRLLNQAVEASKLSPEAQGEAFNRVEKATRASTAPLVRLLMPALAKVSQAHRRTRASLRCALVAAAAERYRLERGQWPASLAELAKDGWIAAVPLDPFDGQPLRYKLVPDGLKIYSVGIDGVDNGGAIDRANPNNPGTDLGFRLWNAELRRQPPLPPPPDDGGAPQ